METSHDRCRACRLPGQGSGLGLATGGKQRSHSGTLPVSVAATRWKSAFWRGEFPNGVTRMILEFQKVLAQAPYFAQKFTLRAWRRKDTRANCKSLRKKPPLVAPAQCSFAGQFCGCVACSACLPRSAK